MLISSSNIILLLVGLIYLIMLPGYAVLDALRIRGLDGVEVLTISFGLGIIIMTGEAIALSIEGSVGLTAQNLIILTAAFVIIIELFRVLKKESYEH
jgi:uncharacterized membrane protein